jgi:uncharacterized membrane protein
MFPRDSHLRSVVKGVSYRLFGSLLTAILSYFVTGSVKTATLVGTAEMTVKVLLYWGHERAWARIRWGRADDASSPVLPVATVARVHDVSVTS